MGTIGNNNKGTSINTLAHIHLNREHYITQREYYNRKRFLSFASFLFFYSDLSSTQCNAENWQARNYGNRLNGIDSVSSMYIIDWFLFINEPFRRTAMKRRRLRGRDDNERKEKFSFTARENERAREWRQGEGGRKLESEGKNLFIKYCMVAVAVEGKP